jgi:hypothetical protein
MNVQSHRLLRSFRSSVCALALFAGIALFPGYEGYGACCKGGACTLQTETVCKANGGTYYGDGSSCEVRRCPSTP